VPASQILKLFRAGKLHSGGSGRVVTNPHQARAIQISEARAEGHHIPFPKKKSRMAEHFREARR
jgi:Family of unknown function (DUF6496)